LSWFFENILAIVEANTGRNAANQKNALSWNIAVIDEQYRFASTDEPDLTPAQFRVVTLDTVTIGPKDSTGFNHVVEYTNRELHELYKTIKG